MQLNNKTLTTHLLKTLEPYSYCTNTRVENFLKRNRSWELTSNILSENVNEDVLSHEIKKVIEYAEVTIDKLIGLARKEIEPFRSKIINELADSYSKVIENWTEETELEFILNVATCYCFMYCLRKENSCIKTLDKINEFQNKYESSHLGINLVTN